MAGEVKSYRDLMIWQKGIALVKEIYVLTRKFPQYEMYGLSNQLRRAAVSIPSNIAEGQARQHPNEFRQHLHISLGSLAEVETQLILAQELLYLEKSDTQLAEEMITELQKMIHAIIKKLK